jgi:hypothetical protein
MTSRLRGCRAGAAAGNVTQTCLTHREGSELTDYSSGSLPTLSVEPQTGVEGHVNSLVRWKWERVRARYALPPAPMSCRVGLVGAGVMGAQLAAAAGRAGLDLVATDTRPDALMTFPGRVA